MSVDVEIITNKVAKPVIKKTVVEFRDGLGTDRELASIGLAKGDIIVFRGEGDPVRFSSGNSSGKVLTTDPTTETGWVLGDGGGGGSGDSDVVTLHNSTGGIVVTGTVVKIDSGINFAKAQAGDNDALFVISEDVGDEEDVTCYSIPNTTCLVRCDTGAVSIGDSLTISSTAGVLTKRTDTTDREVAVAMTAKASGNSGTVKALLSGVSPYEVLAIKDGGTGATTVAGARNNLGLGNTSGALPIANGGTGATTVSDALTNLGITDSGWQTETDGTNYTGTIYWRKIGNIATVTGTSVQLRNSLSGSSVTLLPQDTLPKPKINTVNVCGSSQQLCVLQIYTTGAMTLFKMSSDTSFATNRNIHFVITYMTE